MTKTVNTAGKIVAFVEVPEDATPYMRKSKSKILYKWYNPILRRFTTRVINLPVGSWQILGDSRTLTESDIKPLVVQVDDEWRSAIELWSLLKEANGIVDSNPLGEKPKEAKVDNKVKVTHSDYVRIQKYHDELEAWQHAQSLVKRFLVLVSQE